MTMNITQIKTTKQNKCHLKVTTLGETIKSVADDATFQTVDMLRTFMRYATSYSSFKYMHRLPYILPAAAMKADKGGNLVVVHNNGLITLSVGPFNDFDEAEAMKRHAAALPMTVAAVLGSSGKTVKIIVSVSRPDGIVPQGEAEAEQLLQQACPLLCRIYAIIVPTATNDRTVTISAALPKGETMLLHTGFRMTYDPHPLLCANPAPLQLSEKMAVLQDLPSTDAAANMSDSDNKSASTVSQKMLGLIQMLQERYAFRMNTVMGYPEYRSKEKWHIGWQPVDERAHNSLAMEARLAGLDVWDRDVRRYVHSTRIRQFDPIDDYLFNISGQWDGRDHIRALARTVPTRNAGQWADWFHTWFLAMVAQWQGRDRRYGNAVVPLLISAQGMHKSAFCRMLLPPELRSWGYTDNLSLTEERPVHLAMAQMLLINLDEFNRISPQKQQGFLKNILQLPSVKVKRPYASHTEEVPRLASFIATTNMPDVLHDPTGSRRFLGIEVTGNIDVSQTPNYTQLYAQAQAELQANARYWFDDKETAAIMQHNRQFQQQSTAEQFFHEFFEVVEPTDSGAQWMSSPALLMAIKQQAGATFKAPSLQAFGRTLCSIEGLLYKRLSTGRVFCVRPRF